VTTPDPPTFQLTADDCGHWHHRDITRPDDVDLRLQCVYCGTEKHAPREPAVPDLPDAVAEWQWGIRLPALTLTGLGTFEATVIWCDDEDHARRRATRPGSILVRRAVGPIEEVADV